MTQSVLVDGVMHNFPDEATPEMISQALGVKAPDQSFSQRVSGDIVNRQNQMQGIANDYVGGNMGPISANLQFAGKGAQIGNDIAGEVLKSGYNALPDFAQNYLKGVGQNVSSSIKDSPLGNLVGSALQGYGKFEQNHPVAAGNIGALLNIGSLAASATPIEGVSLADTAASAVGNTAKVTGGALKDLTGGTINLGIKGALGATDALSGLTDSIAGGISSKINRASLPAEFKNIPDADALFLKSLADEGISHDQALSEYANAKEVGAKPSVAVTSNIPSMQTQAYLTSKGSAGSRVAAKAIEDIDINQIPKLNNSIIEQASGGKNLSAEEYGKTAFQEAKKAVDSKINTLKTRASPYYTQSVGLDKSVPIDNPVMQKALKNPLVVKSLEDFRTDPYTLTNVKNNLGELGVDAGDIEKLPYNSTIALHAARVHLRQLGDAAFAGRESQKGAAIKSALNDIDSAIESTYPSYKTARRIYSEDSGALKTLKDSPLGQMATISDGNYSKIANTLMTKDPDYIKKFVANIGSSGADPQKIRDSLAGAFLKRQLEESSYNGRRFSDSAFKSEGNDQRLKSLVGEDRFNQILKIDSVIDDLLKTRSIPAQSITSAANSMKEGVNIPTSKAGIIDSVRKKIAPSLFEMVQKNPQSAARYNELLFTDEGYKLLEKIGSGTTTRTEVEALGDFINKNKSKVFREK